MKKYKKVTFVSDVHCNFELKIKETDILCYCGDLSNKGNKNEITDGLNWLKEQKAECKIMIPGNHDIFIQSKSDKFVQLKNEICSDIVFLNYTNGEDYFIYDGLSFYGCGYTPRVGNWAFMYNKKDAKKFWQKLPDVDILLTHGPPKGILDKNWRDEECGCTALLSAVKKIKPKIHAFGHIHESYGYKRKFDIDFINCSATDEMCRLKNNPVVAIVSGSEIEYDTES